MSTTTEASQHPTDEPPERASRRSWRSRAAPAAAVWSVLACVAGLFWATGAADSPFGVNDRRAADVWSYFEGLQSEPIGWATFLIGLTGLLTVLAGRLLPHHRWPAMPAACLSLVLLLIVPDVRVLQNFTYLFFGHTGLWDLALGAMVVSIVGGVLWALAAVAQLSRGRSLLAAARAPRWGAAVTYASALLALPYPLVRLSWAVGLPLGVPDGYVDTMTGLERLGLAVLFGGLPIAGAVLTLGLVRPWGEVFPRWIPVLRGRRVPIWAAVVPGAWVAIILLQGGMRVTTVTVGALDDMTWSNWGEGLPGLFFLPWGATLAAAVYAYAIRRSRHDLMSGRSHPRRT
ncbi:hypothetical protein K3N28_02530 [Glycomyces sp. TRM65418]|uniref:hypothetical protein n=1 Tax=Glycomyces sp. TRM65418 TaxID=2867006 RepID=UPI001CE60D4C|nr:hypothetical protein [Glycomyces sp. TRM65418]MCC3761946.1 hypothetical protein [Glycomyces sp. TRM65418]QZD56025.1 hypothetical protein K3N28_02520 [Glycomyces sp. TRM65418]